MKQKSIKRNIVFNVMLTVSGFLFPLITYPYVSRTLLPAGIGKVAFVASILSYFSYFASLGIPSYGLREVAKCKDNKETLSKLVQELLIINLCAVLITYIVLIVSALSFPKLGAYKSLFTVMSVSIILTSLGVEWVYQGLEEFEYITKRSIIFRTISVILSFLLIRSESDYLVYGFLTVFTASASNILNFINLRKYISFKRFKNYELKKHLAPIFTLLLASVVITIHANFDVSMLGFLKSENEVGLYNAASKIRNIIVSLSASISIVMVPRIAAFIKEHNRKGVSNLIADSLRMNLLFSYPAAIYIAFNASDCLLLLCGEEFLEARNTMIILCVTVFPLGITNIFGNQVLIPSGKEKIYSQSVFIAMFLNIAMNFALIPSLGALGAAIGTLVAECWNVIWMGRGGLKEFDLKIKELQLPKYILTFSASLILSIFIGKYISVGVVTRILATGGCCFSCYYLLLIAFKEPLMQRALGIIRSRMNQQLGKQG